MPIVFPLVGAGLGYLFAENPTANDVILGALIGLGVGVLLSLALLFGLAALGSRNRYF